MTEYNPELLARLALLADETSDYEGGLRRLTGSTPFGAMLDLIDQTVIPAVLEITNGERVFLIEVSGRRVCRLPGLIEDLTASNVETLAEAARQIADFADRAEGPLWTRELPSTTSGNDPAHSVSIRAIANAAGRPLIDPNAPPIAQFRMRLGNSVTASVIHDNDSVVERLGDADLCAKLENDLADLTVLARDGSGSRLTLYEADVTGQSMRGVAVVANSALVFSTNGIGAATIVAYYNQSIA